MEYHLYNDYLLDLKNTDGIRDYLLNEWTDVTLVYGEDKLKIMHPRVYNTKLANRDVFLYKRESDLQSGKMQSGTWLDVINEIKRMKQDNAGYRGKVYRIILGSWNNNDALKEISKWL